MALFVLLLLSLFTEHGADAACSSHSDCSQSLASLSTDKTYCCTTFCCNFEQYDQGLTTDPFTNMSVGGIIGIVGGMFAFFAALGIFVWCLLKDKGKRQLRPPRERSHHSTSRLDSIPGHAIPTVSGTHHDYDYPPDFEEPEGRDNMAYKTSEFDRTEYYPSKHHRDTYDRHYKPEPRYDRGYSSRELPYPPQYPPSYNSRDRRDYLPEYHSHPRPGRELREPSAPPPPPRSHENREHRSHRPRGRPRDGVVYYDDQYYRSRDRRR